MVLRNRNVKLSLSPVRSLAIFSLVTLLILLFVIPALGAAPQRIVTYTVAPGDSLFAIANKFAVKLSDLQQANSVPVDQIVPGEVLIIPDRDYLTQSYTIQSGDSLFLVACKYGITVSELMVQNGLNSINIVPGQILAIPDLSPVIGKGQPFRTILTQKSLPAPPQFQIVVDKSAHTLALFTGNTVIKSYPVALGDGGPGAKQVQGDHKTPEGFFYIVDKTVFDPADEFLGTRWMRLGYPNIGDAIRGLRQNIIAPSEYQAIISAFDRRATPPQYTKLGGGVGIHGGDPGTGTDWTWGCIGLADQDIEEFFPFIGVGTPVIIKR